MKQDSLWFRVLTARYEVVGGRVGEVGCLASAWWKQMGAIKCGIVESWFDNNLVREVGTEPKRFLVGCVEGGDSIL